MYLEYSMMIDQENYNYSQLKTNMYSGETGYYWFFFETHFQREIS